MYLNCSQCRNFRADSYNSGWHLTSSVAVLRKQGLQKEQNAGYEKSQNCHFTCWKVWLTSLATFLDCLYIRNPHAQNATSGPPEWKDMGTASWIPSQILSVIFLPLHRHKSLEVKHGFTMFHQASLSDVGQPGFYPVPYDVCLGREHLSTPWCMLVHTSICAT